MKARAVGAVFAASVAAWGVTVGPAAQAACRTQSLVRNSRGPFVRLASFGRSANALPRGADVTVQWFGHSYFRLTSKAGTHIATDPLGPGMYPTPAIRAHAVTVGREHRNHNSVEIVGGNPAILRGLTEFGVEWRHVTTKVRDVVIRSIPVYQVGPNGERMKGAAFTFEFGRLCAAHLGDLGGELTSRQRKEIGMIDVLLIPIGGRYTMGPEVARKVLRQIRPRVAIPMHYWDREDLLMVFLRGLRYRRHNGSLIQFSRESLPRQMTVIVLSPPA